MAGAEESGRRGRLIVIEGIDGSGKTTLARNLCDRMIHMGIPAIFTCEPTNGPWGLKLRQGFLSPQRPGPEEEMDLFMKDRMQHVRETIRPALEQGKVIICDRYYFSTMAYQGARGLDPEAIRKANEAFAPIPDLVIIMELSPEEAVRRIRHGRGQDLNNMEELEYLERVSRIFAALTDPFVRRIDASMPEKDIEDAVMRMISGEGESSCR